MRRTPTSTYRLQLHKGFTFDDAAAIADYLRALGVSHAYCSPYLQAAPGSMHGYDVVDPTRVNEELGGPAAHQRFCTRLSELHLGQVLDIVPNHMAQDRENRYWWDVLENGPSSRYASFFDIEWQPQEERLRDKVLLPILADQYGRVLQKGEIRIVRRDADFQVECSGQSLPVSPLSLPIILGPAARQAGSDVLSFLSASFARLLSPDFADRAIVLERHRDQLILQQLLQRTCAQEPTACTAIDTAIAQLNADLNALDNFLAHQHYRIAYWKVAGQQLGYRRFFDVNNLIGLRMERRHVFEETHALILDWLRCGVLDGVRIDHPDGLRDPLEYLRRLREEAPDAWIVAEKILQPCEQLRESWPIEGTSGYDFIYATSAVLLHREGMDTLNTAYANFTGESTDFPVIAHDKKLAATCDVLGSDINRLADLFVQVCEAHRDQRDFTRDEIRRAIRGVAACFANYRTYVMPARTENAEPEITEEDRSYIRRATDCARANLPDIDAGLFDFMRDVMMLEVQGNLESEFLLRLQQFTSPVMAKGLEDTAFYCYNRLTAMNEVGGEPGHNGISIADFHAWCAKMQSTHPLSMTTLSTHDTKRSDDVRARLAVLSEAAEDFAAAVRRWTEINARHKTHELPDRNTEWFYYQTLVGAWPISAERVQQYMLKAAREAKQKTSWIAPNKEYEDALDRFVDSTLQDTAFARDLEAFVNRILHAGRINSLTQTLLKHTAPGVPDLYQGSELWDLSLVDPDNRRPVDYPLRRRLLKEMHTLTPVQIMQRIDEGLPKLWLIHRALTLRRERPEWFGPDASYVPLEVTGARRDYAIAYLRSNSVLTIVSRLPLLLQNQWQDTAIEFPPGRWHNHLTSQTARGGSMSLSEMLRDFPVALWASETINEKEAKHA